MGCRFKRSIALAFVLSAATFIAFIYGVLVGTRHYPPFNTIRKIKTIFTNRTSDRLHNDEIEIIEKRNNLIEFIWGSHGFPYATLPSKIEEGITDENYSGMENLKRIDRITVNMEWKLNSIIYHFIPIKSNNRLVIYHQGHRGDFVLGINAISAFLAKGYSVIALSMPLKGMNNRPVVYLERFGRLKILSHDHLKFLTPEEGHPIKYFLEPVTIALNYAQKYKYEQTVMVGISGGGWTTTLYSAIDPRISHSYPVAGTLPIYLRTAQRDWGDYEQTVPELYNIANYIELYILGSYGDGRKQVQILNKYDPCCFAGIRHRAYEQSIKDRVRLLGKGTFEIYLDDSHREHKISEQALSKIFNELEVK